MAKPQHTYFEITSHKGPAYFVKTGDAGGLLVTRDHPDGEPRGLPASARRREIDEQRATEIQAEIERLGPTPATPEETVERAADEAVSYLAGLAEGWLGRPPELPEPIGRTGHALQGGPWTAGGPKPYFIREAEKHVGEATEATWLGRLARRLLERAAGFRKAYRAGETEAACQAALEVGRLWGQMDAAAVQGWTCGGQRSTVLGKRGGGRRRPGTRTATEERHRRLAEAVEQIRTRDGEHHGWKGRAYEEVAETFECSERTVQNAFNTYYPANKK